LTIQEDDLYIFGPDRQRFLSPVELDRKYRVELELERHETEVERQRAEAERQRAEKLAAKLRELGIDLEEEEIL
jgi:hypothetical protein